MNTNFIKEISADEIKLLKPLMESLANHHNNVSANFKGTYPRHSDKDRISRFELELNHKTSRAFCVYENDNIVGVIKIDIKNKDGVIDYFVVLESCRNFVVLESCRNKGYGKALMDKALDTFSKNGVTNIELHVVYGNDVINFYEKYGFKKQSYIMELRRD